MPKQLAMKLGKLMMITVFLQVSVAGLSQTLNFSGKNVSLKEIFTTIKIQTGVFFFYDADLLRDAKPVTVEWKNVSLDAALNDIFKNQELTWVLEDKIVTVLKRPSQIKFTAEDRSKNSPPIHVTGTIKDMEGMPIYGVSVMIRDSTLGTTSDEDGKFSIQAHENNQLIFSSVNYSSKVLKVEKTKMTIKLQLDIKPMEASVVGGNFNPFKRKAIATSVTVLDAKTLEKIPYNTLDQIFRGWVPGANDFDVGPEREGYPGIVIRGAGSNAFATIAVYIDGIEYAGGSGYLSQLDKSNIDRIEIVRGPGAATMYGTGSNGGIIQIFTKKPRSGESTMSFTTSGGFYKSKWMKQDPFQQMHTLETTTGFKNVVLTLGGTYRTVGAYLPDGGEKNKGFYGSGRFNKGKFQANVSARYNIRNFHLSRDPYYDTAVHPRTDIIIERFGQTGPAYELFFVYPSTSNYRDGITETYLTGVNLSHRTRKNWVNNLDAGFTMNGHAYVPAGENPLQTQYSRYKKKITTIRYSNVLSLSAGPNGPGVVITSGAEYKKYSASQIITRATAARTFSLGDPDNNNYGAFVQVNPSYKNIFLTMGMRYEKNELFTEAWNPRVGLTTNFKVRSLTIKPRIAWGKGIQAPAYEERFGRTITSRSIIYPNPDLKPQSQQGFDYGVELYDKKGSFKFEAVYYDNLLQNIIFQEVLGLPSDSTLGQYIYNNIYELVNRGWEFSGEYRAGRLGLRGTFSLMKTTIGDTTGNHRYPALANAIPGTRMTGYARHVAGLNLSYQFNKLFRKTDKGLFSLNISEFGGLRSADSKRYALDVAYGRVSYPPDLFSYPYNISAIFRVGLYADYNLVDDWRIFIQGTNILNDNTHERSSDYLTHGATWLFGFKYNFYKSQ